MLYSFSDGEKNKTIITFVPSCGKIWMLATTEKNAKTK